MPQTQDRKVRNWLIGFGSLAIILIVFGGYVRLTRSGLSIAEWKPLSGVMLPMAADAWELEFDKYRATPEYQQLNRGMLLDDYKRIYLIEWTHRLIARAAGLVFAVPFFVFLLGGRIPWRESALYVAMGALFLAQAAMGWIMVSSGLIQRPSVSHYLLAVHLCLALALVGLAAWTALGHHYGFHPAASRASWSAASLAILGSLGILLIQIVFGAFTAGLHAGLVSNSWPTMLGRWLPEGLLSQVRPPILSIVAAPLTVAFIHRWLAFCVLLAASLAIWAIIRSPTVGDLRRGAGFGIVFGLAQIGLGIAVVISRVDIALALLHQLNALFLFAAAVYLLHRSRGHDHRTAALASTTRGMPGPA